MIRPKAYNYRDVGGSIINNVHRLYMDAFIDKILDAIEGTRWKSNGKPQRNSHRKPEKAHRKQQGKLWGSQRERHMGSHMGSHTFLDHSKSFTSSRQNFEYHLSWGNYGEAKGKGTWEATWEATWKPYFPRPY